MTLPRPLGRAPSTTTNATSPSKRPHSARQYGWDFPIPRRAISKPASAAPRYLIQHSPFARQRLATTPQATTCFVRRKRVEDRLRGH